MKQEYKPNRRFDILTPTGWEDFQGVIKNTGEQDARMLITDDRMIVATPTHRLFSHGVEKLVRDVVVGDQLDSRNGPRQVIAVRDGIIKESYDIFRSESHRILANSFVSHQCDEFAFVPVNKGSEFWTSIQPVLSEGGSCIITSTPKNDEDQFAQIWKGAVDNTDEYGNPDPSGLGKNGWYAISVPWHEHPERGEEWAKPFRETLGEARFRQEFCCISGDARVTVRRPDGRIERISVNTLRRRLAA